MQSVSKFLPAATWLQRSSVLCWWSSWLASMQCSAVDRYVCWDFCWVKQCEALCRPTEDFGHCSQSGGCCDSRYCNCSGSLWHLVHVHVAAANVQMTIDSARLAGNRLHPPPSRTPAIVLVAKLRISIFASRPANRNRLCNTRTFYGSALIRYELCRYWKRRKD